MRSESFTVTPGAPLPPTAYWSFENVPLEMHKTTKNRLAGPGVLGSVGRVGNTTRLPGKDGRSRETE